MLISTVFLKNIAYAANLILNEIIDVLIMVVVWILIIFSVYSDEKSCILQLQ